MAVPRPLLLVLLGTILLAATFFATRNSETGSEKASKPAAVQAPAPTPQTPEDTTLSAQDAVRALVAPGRPIKSGRLSIRFTSRELRGRHERDAVTLSGPFSRAPAGNLASFDFRITLLEDGKRSTRRAASTGDRAFAAAGGRSHELPQRSVRNAKSALAAIGKGRPQAAKLAAPDPAAWTKGLKAEDGGMIGGVATTHVSGKIDSQRLTADVKRVVAGAAQGSSRRPAALPRGFARKLDRALKQAKLDAYVGTQDRIFRRIRLTVTGVVPKELLERGETPRWRSVLSISMTGVNQPQTVSAPANASKSPLPRRERRSGEAAFLVSAILADPPAGLAQTSLGFMRLAQLGEANRTPRAVARNIRAHRKVVVFFYQRKGIDDAITADAVAALRLRTHAAVFADSVDHVAAYGQVVQAAGVNRAPSIVVIGKQGRARLIEGYVDSETLAQEVIDTR